MELELILNGLATAATIGAVSYTTICLLWCTLLVLVFSQLGRPMHLRDESNFVVTLGVAFHALCWPYSMKTLYDRRKRRRETLSRSTKRTKIRKIA